MNTYLEAVSLPDSQKEDLCRSLLEEFGLSVKRVRKGEELVVACTLGEHRNQDRDPTGALNFKKLVYKCLGCGASGGLLWFITEHRGGTSRDARTWLAEQTGTEGHVMDLSALLRYFDALYANKPGKAPIPTYSERVLEPWMLIHPYLTDAPEYDEQGRNVGGRGIPEQTLERFKVGYAEAYPYEKNRTSERIVIPHFWKGKLVGWQTRRLSSDGTAKFKSTGDFPKDTTIYNYDPEAKSAIVVEAAFSVLRHEHHQHLESTFGANVTDSQIRLLGRHPRLYWWLDNDHAGWNAYRGHFDSRGRQTRMGVLEATSQMTDVWVIDSPYPADPADLTDDLVDSLVDQAVPWPIWTPPRRWECFRCHQDAHEGGCVPCPV